MKILSLWSGPRNVSTALMYSFAQRPDTHVIDEPLYAHYLANTPVEHPGGDEVLQVMENDGDKVLTDLFDDDHSADLIFLKNMAHHWIHLNDNWLAKMDHLFLIRDPREMLPSLINQIPQPILRDTGLKMQYDLYHTMQAQGKKPEIIDSKRLLLNPAVILRKACDALQIPFTEGMLRWEAGARPEDGVWAKQWYHSVHQSTGFSPYKTKTEPFPDQLLPLLEECEPYYQFLLERALQ
ncbi:sulfotransferase family protein [Fulvivirga ligni]|uniref:sulfotransferase-like domain-containing protein n=1 Tax=Fulvivirga ligni TaxID=2904246 RepID=UPI001F1A983F|nr:sulfotransferase family protein [Fulvivirga ligni]UII22456.1 sulfotransferase family protein [Fulvivirga ligni]